MYTHKLQQSYLLRRCSLFFQHQLSSQERRPPGGVFYLVGSITKNPEKEDPPRSTWYKLFEGGPLAPSSLLENPPNRGKTLGGRFPAISLGSSTNCNTLQHTATHCSTLQHTATHHTAILCAQTLQHSTLQNAASRCNILQ